MPFFIGISVISFLTISIIYIYDISISSDLLAGINTASPFVGVVYMVAGWFFGSPVRMATGLSLAFISAVDLGVPESLNSSMRVMLVIIGALTPI